MMLPAGKVITDTCRSTTFTRSHVAALLRRHAADVGARKVGARWWIRADSVGRFKEIVATTSGKRRKLGERD